MTRPASRLFWSLLTLAPFVCRADAEPGSDVSYIIWGPLPNSLLLFGLLGLAAAVAALAVQLVRSSE